MEDLESAGRPTAGAQESHRGQGDEGACAAEGAESAGPVRPALRPPFGQAVGFLLSQLGFETARRFGQLMGQMELEPRQFALMRSIEAAEGRSQNEVGEALRIPPSSMVAVIDLLERRGLVERRPHPSDRRARLLYMTPDGRELLAGATKLAMGLESVVSEGLSPEERATLLDMLSRVADNLGLTRGVHPDASTGHGRPHWTDEVDATGKMPAEED